MRTASYLQALVNDWETDRRTADEVVRELRTTLAEDAEIEAAEEREAAKEPYNQLTDLDDLLVAREELQTLYDYEQNNGDDARLHGLDVAITVLTKLTENLTPEEESV